MADDNTDIRPVDQADVIDRVGGEGNILDKIVEVSNAKLDRPDPVDNGVLEIELTQDEYDAAARAADAHPHLFKNDVSTKEDILKAVAISQDLQKMDSERDLQAAQRQSVMAAKAVDEAHYAYENEAFDDEDVYGVIDNLAKEIGPTSPQFKEFLAYVASDPESGDALVAREWVRDVERAVADAARQAESAAAAARLVARGKESARIEAELNKTAKAFKERNEKRIARAGATPAEVLSSLDLSDISSGQELDASLELALNAAETINSSTAISDYINDAFADRLARDWNGAENVPEHEPVASPDLSRIAPKAPRVERLKTFGDAFDAATRVSQERRAEADRVAARAEKWSEEQTLKHGRKPR